MKLACIKTEKTKLRKYDKPFFTINNSRLSEKKKKKIEKLKLLPSEKKNIIKRKLFFIKIGRSIYKRNSRNFTLFPLLLTTSYAHVSCG